MKVKNISKILMGVAAVLLVFSGVEGSRAALNVKSNTFDGQLVMPKVGVEIMQNDKIVSDGVIYPSVDPNVILGKTYAENIGLQNTGTIPEYVRATVVAYWEKPVGENEFEKDLSVDPSTIKLTFADGWTVNADQSTAERTVLYRSEALEKDATDTFVTGITVDGSLATKCRVVDMPDGSKYLEYAYDGYKLVLKATVDCVQAGGAMDAEAIEANWGVKHTDKGVNITIHERN